eukprot:SAG25_NODE_419_length_8245_cov_3.527744_11_plen_66_part_00
MQLYVWMRVPLHTRLIRSQQLRLEALRRTRQAVTLQLGGWDRPVMPVRRHRTVTTAHLRLWSIKM